MKVIEVIDKCIDLLEVKCTKEDLLDCFKLVEQQLALEYFPLYATHKCNSNIVYYDEFEYVPVRIVSGNCKFRVKPTHLESKELITEVVYAYAPNQKGLYDECSYDEHFLNCIAYGMIAAYLCTQCFYEESIVWEKKYKKEISNLYN